MVPGEESRLVSCLRPPRSCPCQPLRSQLFLSATCVSVSVEGRRGGVAWPCGKAPAPSSPTASQHPTGFSQRLFPEREAVRVPPPPLRSGVCPSPLAIFIDRLGGSVHEFFLDPVKPHFSEQPWAVLSLSTFRTQGTNGLVLISGNR